VDSRHRLPSDLRVAVAGCTSSLGTSRPGTPRTVGENESAVAAAWRRVDAAVATALLLPASALFGAEAFV
jgi:hypothetical protein